MLSLIKAHCFKIKGDWYLIYPNGEMAKSWYLPARALRWYILFEITFSLINASLAGGLIVLAIRGSGLTVGLILVGSFVMHFVTLKHVLLAVGGRPSPYTLTSLQMRGHLHPYVNHQYPSHFPVHALLIIWLMLVGFAGLLLIGAVFAWNSDRGLRIGMAVVAVGAVALAWGISRFQKWSVRYISTADIDPPAQ